MINIKNLFKKFGIFILIEVLLVLVMSFFNLIGVNSSFTKILIFISNIVIFFVFGFKSGKKSNRKGLNEGLINGFILIGILFLISLIFYAKSFSLGTIFYYLTLMTTSIISAIIGKNKKVETTQG
ncbi:MAG: TIGR04086 family membrane protein [Bacilli bacterium]|nr:TIGR04086 family membrane protein [Bacilli bacterium]